MHAIAIIVGLAICGGDVGKCPVSGKPAKEDVFLEVNGKKVHFCCDGCVKGYEKKLGVVDEGPKTCPVSKKDAKAETRLLVQKAETVHFCCEGCIGKYLAREKLKASDPGPKKCAACDKDAKADVSLDVNGEQTYFCCEECRKAYLKKLPLADKAGKDAEPGKCPVSGEPADEKVSLIRLKTEAVYFCCNNCRKAYLEKTLKTLAEAGKEPAKEKEPEAKSD